jgi:hypothetical protein
MDASAASLTRSRRGLGEPVGGVAHYASISCRLIVDESNRLILTLLFVVDVSASAQRLHGFLRTGEIGPVTPTARRQPAGDSQLANCR